MAQGDGEAVQAMTQEEPQALAKITWHDQATGELHRYVLLEGATASIGRARSNDICVAERHVSRRHAVITYRNGIFMISDLGSANGTFVNDQRLEAPFPLASGDVIRLFVPELLFSAMVTDEEQQHATRSGTLIRPPHVLDRPYLVVTSGPQEGAEFLLERDMLIVGRAAPGAVCDIALQDRSVSRPHARLERLPDGSGWGVVDLGSANGTRINGQLIRPEVCCPLRHGDVLAFGSTLLLFRLG